MLLLCRVLSRLCAVPLAHVRETMRPLPIEPVYGLPSFVRGVAVIRGIATPVVDAGALFGGSIAAPARFVTLKTGGRAVALAVDHVVGVHAIAPAVLRELPPLLKEVGTELVSELGTRDGELLFVLRTAHLIPQSVWTALDDRRTRS